MSSAEPSRRLAYGLLAAAALAAWGGTLSSTAWVRDDRMLLLENPTLNARAAGPLLLGGYWQAVKGDAAPIHQWRPVLSLSFLAQVATTGFAQPPLRAVNLLLHLAVAVLLFEALRRRHGGRPALAGALLWTVLPAHAEVTAYLTSRSELLAATSVLGAWALLGAPEKPRRLRLAAGAGVFLLGALSKEHVILFPAFLALADWSFAGLTPWKGERRRVHGALLACVALVLAGRLAVLPAVAAGGPPYFGAETSALTRLLTLAKFWVLHYARPLFTGEGMCLDYSRPAFPDAAAGDAAAWACLLLVAALAAAALRGLAGRRPWAFWLVGPALFLLPTSHLLMDLDTIGATRFLYLPSLFLAWAAGTAYDGAPKRGLRAASAAFFVLLVAAAARSRAEARIWSSEEAVYRAALDCNPGSAHTRSALGVTLLRAGRAAEGEALLRSALDADPSHYPAAYDLALAAQRRGDRPAARRALAAAAALEPSAPDVLSLQGLLAEEDGRVEEAVAAYRRAARLRPHDAAARFNLARALALARRPAEAATELDAFLRLAPHDPDAPAARRWRETLPR